ncbi:hypothetical protein BGZ57DRAFT_926059 [Hyaloscypha finlandica]|nr:hypothetical protein BGZ57DRAFT_926059 [Hyaloscypha finlandica]
MSRTLRRDIYGLHTPGFLIDSVKPPDPDPLSTARYSCVYWVDHLCDIEASHDKIGLGDNGVVHVFLKERFLHWMEALSLLKNIPVGVLSMVKLERLLQHSPDAPNLINLVRDARRFILCNKFAIENRPLQVYALALVFSPASSITRDLFKQEDRKWITTKPAMENDWGSCLQTLEGHGSWVDSVAFSHDSKLVASASNDCMVKIWDTATGQCMQTLEGHLDWVSSAAFSHDSKLVASASSDCMVKIWDTATGQCMQTLEGHLDWVGSVAFSHDSKLVASASYDRTIKIWNTATGTGQCLQTLKGHRDSVISVAFSHDSKLVASASYDKTVKIWGVDTGQCLQTLKGHRNWVSLVALSHDSKQVASASYDRTVKIWDTATGRCLQTLEGHNESVISVAFSHDPKQVMSASGEPTVKTWDAATGQCLQTLEGHSEPVISVAFSPDGKIFASGSTTGTVRLWDADSGAWKQGQENSFGGQRKVSEVEDSLIAMATSESPPNEQDEQASTAGTFTTLFSDQAGSTNPSSMSCEAVADTEQVIEGRSSMTFFNYKNLAIEHKPGEKYDDIQSVKSIPDDIESLVESNSGMANYRQAAVNYIVKMFTSDPELLALYQEATQSMDEAKFVRNHRRLLKTFFLDLRSEGRSPSQTLAVGFLRSRNKRIHISSAIRNLVMPSDSTVGEKINIVLEQEKDNLFLLDRLLNERDSAAQQTPTNTSDEISDADIASEVSENSDDDDDRSSDESEPEIQEDNALSKLEATAEFLTCGRSFSLYKENLRGFLHPAPEAANLQGSLQLDVAETSSVVPEQLFSNQNKGERDKISSQIAMLALPGKETISPSNSRTWRQGLLRIIVLALLTIIPGGEMPSKQGMKRVRWTCFCGRRLYDEFCETIPGGIEEIQEIQRALDTVYAAPNHRFYRQVGRLFGISENSVSGIAHSRWRPVVDRIVPFCVVAVAIAYVWAPIHYPSTSMLISLLLYGSLFSTTTAVFFVTGLIIKLSTDQVEFYDSLSVSTPGEQENPEDHRGMRKPSPVHIGVSGSGVQAAGGTGTSSSADTGIGPDKAEAGSPAGNQGRSGYSRNDHTSGGEDATYDHPGGDNSDPAADGRRHGMDWDRRENQLWLLVLFENTLIEDVYVHINARVRNTDFTLFKGFREKYLLVSSGWKRFCRLRQVSALRVVQFHLVDNKRGDVINKDVWPPKHEGSETRLWYYVPYPAKESIPPVGPRHLMSVWRNAHHADAAAYEDFTKKATWHARMLEKILHFPHQACQTLRISTFLFGFSTGALDFDDDPDLAAIADNSLPAEMHPVDAEQPEKQSRSKYIFARLPKRAGSKLEANFQNDEYPEAWGIQFEERFYVHRALFVLLIFYTLFSIALGIWLLKTYGLNLPKSAVSVVGLLTWPLSFMGLAVTVWFKWAENS